MRNIIVFAMLLAAVSQCLSKRHFAFRTNQHEILENTWFTNDYCYTECIQNNGTVCGTIAKECCDNAGCNSVNACNGADVPITCFGFKDSWTVGDTCQPDCNAQGGNSCGNLDITCCRGDNCESHAFGVWYTCDDQYTIKHIKCP